MNKVRLVLGLLLLGFVIGCGSVSNNDQGVSFLHLGYFSIDIDEDGKITIQKDVGVSGVIMPLSEATDEFAGASGDTFVAAGFENNLVGQFVRLQRLYYSFVVPGAQAQPPSTSAPLAGTLGANPATEDEGDSSLPPGAGPTENSVYLTISIVPSQIRAWLNLNRGLLPEPPFDLEVTTIGRGVTSAGDTLETNPQTLIVRVTPDNVIPPSTGSEEDAAAADEVATDEALAGL